MTKIKAAFIPQHNGKLLFCRSSNPMFGGPDFALAKGNIDKGETPQEAAVREAQEELGLRLDNIDGIVEYLGDYKTFGYTLAVYYANVKDPEAFNPPCWEIAETKWMTPKEFLETGRDGHRHIIESFINQLKT